MEEHNTNKQEKHANVQNIYYLSRGGVGGVRRI
jgi:hypothetical protein